MLNINDIAPEVELFNQNGELFRLSEFKGQKVIIYFYPKDSTCGCIKHAVGFKEIYDVIVQNNIKLVGISKDSANSHIRFIEKYGLPFDLLIDKDLSVAKAYDSIKLKISADGEQKVSTLRSTFVIDEKGNIKSIIRDVKPEYIAAKALEAALAD